MKTAAFVLLMTPFLAQLALAQDLELGASPSLAMPLGANVPFGEEVYNLVSVQGQQADFTTQISFADGRVAGQGPCNSFFADLTYTDSRFELANFSNTEIACPDLDAEVALFALLTKVTSADRREGQITLFTPEGGQVYFVAQGQ